jgi:hypothetical protein
VFPPPPLIAPIPSKMRPPWVPLMVMVVVAAAAGLRGQAHRAPRGHQQDRHAWDHPSR